MAQKKKKARLPVEKEFIRLNKMIADAGICSRRKADELIREGRVKINRKTVIELGTRVRRSDFITVDGDPIKEKQQLDYILLNKPKDYITTTSDEKDRKTVMDIVRKRKRLYPVGRLDRNTTGALLITNDGDLANRLMHPRYEVERTYIAKLDKEIDPAHASKISGGVELEDGMTAPCHVFIRPDDKSIVSVTLIEGKNHEVKRLFSEFGYFVKSLERKFYANLDCRGLKRGQYRHLNRREVANLKKLVGLK